MEPRPSAPSRVVGHTGAGKTTLARRCSAKAGAIAAAGSVGAATRSAI